MLAYRELDDALGLTLMVGDELVDGWYVMLVKVPNKETQTVVSALIKQAKKLPNELYKSLTWDRGRELTDHHRFNLDVSGLIEALTAQTTLVTDGDLDRGEAMLTTQAHTLDAVFNNLARRAINAEYMNNLDSYLKLALRAQSQCRATWETLATMKNPPMMGYVRQANIAQGHQQVNNAPSTAGVAPRAGENPDLQSKLLEQNDGERLDIGAAGAAGPANPAMATLGEGDRTKDAGG